MFLKIESASVDGFLRAYITSAPDPPPAFRWFDITITFGSSPYADNILFVLSVGVKVMSVSLVKVTGMPNSFNLSYMYLDIFNV